MAGAFSYLISGRGGLTILKEVLLVQLQVGALDLPGGGFIKIHK